MHLTFITAVLTLPVWHRTSQLVFTKELPTKLLPSLMIETSGCACQLWKGGWGRTEQLLCLSFPTGRWADEACMCPAQLMRPAYSFRKIISWCSHYSSTDSTVWAFDSPDLWLLQSLTHYPRFELPVCCRAFTSLSSSSLAIQLIAEIL